jgi:hypothetical protein
LLLVRLRDASTGSCSEELKYEVCIEWCVTDSKTRLF